MLKGEVMPHLEPVQIAALAIALVVGLLLGFVGNTSGGKWRKRYHKDRDFYADYREKSEALIAEKAQRIADLEGRLAHATAPVAAFVQPVEAVAEVAPEAEIVPEPAIVPEPTPEPEPEPVAETHAAETVAAVEEAAAEPVIAEEAAPDSAPAADVPPEAIAESTDPVAEAEPELPHSETVAEDPALVPVVSAASTAELTRIRGIDAGLAARLADVGVRTPEDIEKLSAEDEMALEKRLSLSTGQIALEQWRLQAALLGSGDDHDDYASPAQPEHHADAAADPHDTVEPAPHRPMAVASEGAAAV